MPNHKHDISAIVSSGRRITVSSNAVAQLPPYLAFGWLTIESVSKEIAIPADLACRTRLPLLVRGRDFAFWFRMNGGSVPDRWKSLILYKGKFRSDIRCRWVG